MIEAAVENAWTDFVYWQNHDPATADKIINLIREIKRDSFKGIGKPEPLKGNLAGYWSRRITGEHRLVYRISGTKPRSDHHHHSGTLSLSIIKSGFRFQAAPIT